MTEEEFLEQWPKFLDAFSQAFDTDEIRESVHQQVLNNYPSDAPAEERITAFVNAYQTLRTDNLIKAAIQNFVVDRK